MKTFIPVILAVLIGGLPTVVVSQVADVTVTDEERAQCDDLLDRFRKEDREIIQRTKTFRRRMTKREKRADRESFETWKDLRELPRTLLRSQINGCQERYIALEEAKNIQVGAADEEEPVTNETDEDADDILEEELEVTPEEVPKDETENEPEVEPEEELKEEPENEANDEPNEIPSIIPNEEPKDSPNDEPNIGPNDEPIIDPNDEPNIGPNEEIRDEPTEPGDSPKEESEGEQVTESDTGDADGIIGGDEVKEETEKPDTKKMKSSKRAKRKGAKETKKKAGKSKRKGVAVSSEEAPKRLSTILAGDTPLSSVIVSADVRGDPVKVPTEEAPLEPTISPTKRSIRGASSFSETTVSKKGHAKTGTKKLGK